MPELDEKEKFMKRHLVAALIAGLSLGLSASAASAAIVFSNTHSYGGVVSIDVTVEDNYLGDFGKYWWKYDVTNVSFNPNPGVSNGFSGLETALPSGVPDLMDRAAPVGWIFDCCSGQPVEYDIRNSIGLGIMPGGTGQFSFTSLPRFITNSTGYFHTWQNDIQTNVTTFASFGEPGPEVPDVLRPPITVPEPATLALVALSFFGLGLSRRKGI